MISIDDEMSEITSEQIAFLKARCNDEDVLKMNLIKKLGGYDNSKCYLESCGDMDLIGGFTPSQITEALLQYRKKTQHLRRR